MFLVTSNVSNVPKTAKNVNPNQNALNAKKIGFYKIKSVYKNVEKVQSLTKKKLYVNLALLRANTKCAEG